MSEERFVIDYDLEELEEENVKVRAKIEEQQATIEQLQEKINMEYAEQIVEENQKLRIAKNDLRIENEQLRKQIQNYEQLISNSMSKKQCCLFEEESFDKYLTERLNEKEEIIKEQERRIIVLENLLTNIGVKWVDDDK